MKDSLKKRFFAEENDPYLLGVIGVLLVFGLIMIFSAGVIYSQSRFADSNFFFKRQFLFGFLPGMVALYFGQKIDYHFWKKIAVPMFFAAVIFLVLVFVPGLGSKVYGASRWLQLGPFSFQPSEMAKLSIVIYLAAWLEGRGMGRIKDLQEGLLPFLGIMGLISFLIIKQPDTGTLGVIVLTAFSIFFISGAKSSHLAGLVLLGAFSLVLLVALEPYRMERIETFLNLQNDPQGSSYQVNQALIAVGSGGFWGHGIGKSRQKFNYLPEPVGDSIFAVTAEEVGFVGSLGLVFAFLFLAMRGLRIARRAPDQFGQLVAVGITAWIFFQAFINIGANVAILPLTGIPLPFISYGGTSLVFLMLAVGIVLNISKHSRI